MKIVWPWIFDEIIWTWSFILIMYICIYLREMECYDKNSAIEWLVWPWYEGWIGGGKW